MIFNQMFRDQTFVPCKDFIPRDWQMECAEDYSASVTEWLTSRQNGVVGSQHCFCVYAGTGSGKTKAAGLIACYMLNHKLVDQVVLICPNKSIRRKTREDFRDIFGIELTLFSKKSQSKGIPRMLQGYILTYAHIMKDPTLHRRICSPDTLVIFDEVHHLSHNSSWGESAIEAFGRVGFIVTMTGTPYRSKDEVIPFVSYEDTESNGIVRFKATPPVGFTYPLGRAVADGVCREPLFVFCGGDEETKVRIRTGPVSGEILVSFKDTDVSEAIAALRLRGAVQFSSLPRKAMLRAALDKCREEKRKVIIFLGGDTDGDHTPTVDATELLPSELREMGISDHEFEVVTGDDVAAQNKIATFGASEKWILISINMVSEGTDIPELSAAIFLTSITANQTTVQRIGRVLRLMGPKDSHKSALIFLFQDKNLVTICREIKAEIDREINLVRRRGKGTDSGGNGDETNRYRSEAIGISGGRPTMVKFGDREWPIDIFEAARQKLREYHVSPTVLEVALTLMMGERNGRSGNEFVG
jgi:superfamily II DNA or RNA helicase